MVKAIFSKRKPKTDDEVIGLVDGGHTYIECSSCGAKLIDVFHTRPDAIDPGTGKPFHWKLQATCGFCGDTSYVTEVTGKYHLGPYGVDKQDDETDDVILLSIDKIEPVDDKLIIHTIQRSKGE